MASSRSTGKRLPISCQACRTRKIRCSRDGRPCQTCVRRGLGAEDCIYLGQPRLSTESVSTDPAVQNELLARIRNLEGLLQRQASSQTATPTGEAASPMGAPSASGSLSESELGPGLDPWGSSLPNNVGNLLVYPSGHVRYVPLASQWESVVAKSPAAGCLQRHDSDIIEDDDLQIPLARNGNISRAELLALLPPSRYCDLLKDVYFRVFSSVFHILHDSTFDAEYLHFYHDPGSVSTSWLALLFAILAIAVSALDDDDPLLSDLGRERTVSRNIKVLSARYRSAALQCLAADGVMTRHTINSLQALVLINYARLQRGLPFWTLLGLTHHVAISMGCHVDPEMFLLGPIEREERRRVWTGLMMLHTIQNTSFGSLSYQRFSHDVKMPADIDDGHLLSGPTVTSDPSSSPSTSRPTQMTFLLTTYRLHTVSNKICETLFSSHQSRYSVSQLETEILAIRELCDTRYQVDQNQEPLPVQHQANQNILQSHINQLLLLLLRPGLCRFLQGEITPETCASRAKCVASAKASLSNFHTLADSPQFTPYKWHTSGLGSFHAFHAAVVLAVDLSLSETRAEFDETKETLNRALELFASLSVRSPFSSKAVPVIRQIVDVSSTHYHQTQQQQQSRPHPGAQAPMMATFPPNMPSMTMHDGFVLSHSQSQSPVPAASSSSSDPTMHSSLGMPLQAQNWVAPTAIPWDVLGSSMDQFGFESDVP